MPFATSPKEYLRLIEKIVRSSAAHPFSSAGALIGYSGNLLNTSKVRMATSQHESYFNGAQRRLSVTIERMIKLNA
jgi:hypothetical protein